MSTIAAPAFALISVIWKKRRSVTARGYCFSFVEYIAVKKGMCKRTQHHQRHATSPYHYITQDDYVIFAKRPSPQVNHRTNLKDFCVS